MLHFTLLKNKIVFFRLKQILPSNYITNRQYFLILNILLYFLILYFNKFLIIPFILNKICKNVILSIIYFCYIFTSYLRNLKRLKYKIR